MSALDDLKGSLQQAIEMAHKNGTSKEDIMDALEDATAKTESDLPNKTHREDVKYGTYIDKTHPITPFFY